MGSLTQYSNLMLNSKLRQLAEMSIQKNRSPFLALVEASGKTNVPIKSVLNVLSEWWGDNNDIDFEAAAKRSAFFNRGMKNRPAKAAPVAQAAPPESHGSEIPQDVNGLTNMLKQIVQSLSIDHKISPDQINKLVSQATQGMATKSVDTGGAKMPDGAKLGDFGTGSFTGDEGGSSMSPEMMKQFGTQSIYAPNAEDPSQMKPAPAAPAANPAWYNQMTNAERAWFDNLKKTNPEAARQFTLRHDVGKSGDAVLQQGSPEWNQAQEIARRTRERNPWMTDDKATFNAAAGLVNRHKIRQDLSKLYGKGGDWEGDASPMDNFDDLLHKDHTKNLGSIMNEWCHLAGVKEERKKSKKKGR